MPRELERFEVAGPGFLNLFLSDSWLTAALARVLAAGHGYGFGGAPAPQRVLVEFVSANPTGPMHVGHARNAAYGDALARMLAAYGHSVEREFYVNDAGAQIRRFGESVSAVARGEQPPEDGYHGDYVAELAQSIPGAREDDPAEVGRVAVARMVQNTQEVLGAFGVQGFDHWTYESELYAGHPNLVERTLAILAESGHTYTSDGALWLRTTEFGDDKDRVLVRSNGENTYFASDIAYHQSRRERGYERQIDIWGADHHGYLLRMKAAYAALGGDPDELELADHAARAPAAGRRAGTDVKAGGGVRDARGARAGDRGGRRALVPAGPLPRHDRGPRPRPGPRAVGREPRLLRPVRPRPHRLDRGQGGDRPPAGGAGGRGNPYRGSRFIPPSGR